MNTSPREFYQPHFPHLHASQWNGGAVAIAFQVCPACGRDQLQITTTTGEWECWGCGQRGDMATWPPKPSRPASSPPAKARNGKREPQPLDGIQRLHDQARAEEAAAVAAIMAQSATDEPEPAGEAEPSPRQEKRATVRKSTKARNSPPRLQPRSGMDLYRAEFEDPVFAIPGLLAKGVTLFAGPPKAGKSWWTLQIAVGAAHGGTIGGHFPVGRPHRVLYLALEDTERRTHSRLHAIGASDSVFLDNVAFVYAGMIQPWPSGGREAVDEYLSRNPCGLVVVDTLSAAMHGSRQGNPNDVFRSQYSEVDSFRTLAEKHDAAFLVVTHTRKGGGEGVEAVAGTGGITAAADAIWTIQRKAQGAAVLDITGREMEETSLALQFHSEQPTGWSVEGEGEAARMSDDRRAVLAMLGEEGGMRIRAIAANLRKSYTATQRLLHRMWTEGAVTKRGSTYSARNQTVQTQDESEVSDFSGGGGGDE